MYSAAEARSHVLGGEVGNGGRREVEECTAT